MFFKNSLWGNIVPRFRFLKFPIHPNNGLGVVASNISSVLGNTYMGFFVLEELAADCKQNAKIMYQNEYNTI